MTNLSAQSRLRRKSNEFSTHTDPMFRRLRAFFFGEGGEGETGVANTLALHLQFNPRLVAGEQTRIEFESTVDVE